MNQEEIKAEIDTKSACRVALLGFAKDFEDEIAAREAELVQAVNPGLQQGDYGDGPAGPWLRVHGRTWWDTKRPTGPSHHDADVFIPYRQGNHFRDREALSKPLTHFKADVHQYKFNFKEFPDAPIQIAGNWHTLKDAKQISLDIQRVIRTAELEAANE